MGGVLLDLDIEGCKSAFRSLLGFEGIDNIIDAWHQKGIWGEMEEGRLAPEEFRRIILAGSRPGSAPDLVDQAVSRILIGMDPYKAVMLRYMMQSYDLYILSNNNPICVPFAAKIFADLGVPFEEVFHKLFLSCDMKVLKPSAEFYQRVMDEIGCSVEDMLFIDDSQKNVDGALAAGLPAIYYEPGSDLAALLADALGDPSIAAAAHKEMEGSR